MGKTLDEKPPNHALDRYSGGCVNLVLHRSKVKVISHWAYGFRQTDHYITAVWRACGDLPLEPVA
jgi:hypothetical protein